MARPMNVQKRIETFRRIVGKTKAEGERSLRIADELASHFEGNRSPDAREARALAKAARRLGHTLGKAASRTRP
jgi:hypothetical protein